MIRRLFRLLLAAVLGLVALSFLLLLALRWVDPPTSMVILAWELQSGRAARHQWRPIEAISPHLQIAVIATEDQKFPTHFGFDFDSIQKALGEDRRRLRGASTISQQTAKNLFLWHGRSYLRKALEAWFTLLMECLWPKQRILEVYLNVAEFGAGVYGAEAAAGIFFATTAEKISPWQAGLLAAVLPSPQAMSASQPSDYVRARAQKVSTLVAQLGGAAYLRNLSE